MWFWIVFVSLANMQLMFSVAENVGSELQEDDAVYLYVDDRNGPDTNQEKKELAARRQDKNFLRFGRSGTDFYLLQSRPYDVEDVDYYDEFSRPARTLRNENFIRFGRGKATDFIRFGRDPLQYINRELRSGHDKNYIRFGRSVPVKRSRRDVDDYEEQKRQRNMVRFGRNDHSMPVDRTVMYKTDDNQAENYEEQKRQRNMVRFGRNDNSMPVDRTAMYKADTQADNYEEQKRQRNMLRYGRNDKSMTFGRAFETDSRSDNQNGSHVSNENHAAHFYPINIVPVLKQLAARLRKENNCIDCTRFG